MKLVLARTREPAILALVVLASLVPVLLGNAYLTQVAATTTVFVVAVVGYNLVLGETGLLSLSHAAFMGVGAYAYAALSIRGLPSLLAVLAALVVCAVLALVIGLLTLRVRHLYFAIATFGASEILRNIANEWDPVTGGAQGLVVPPLEFLGWSFHGAREAYYVGIALVVLALIGHAVTSRSRLGRRLRCVREDDLTAGVMGVPVLRTELTVFVIGAVFAALAGCLYGITLTFIDPSLLDIHLMVLLIAMLVVGGSGSAAGAVIGAVLISATPEVLRFLGEFWEIVYGGIILVAILAGRRGIIGFLRSLWSKVTGRERESSKAELRLDLPDADVFRPDGQPIELVVRGVRKTFGGVVALEDVDATFPPGSVHALIGPNGSGKSTLVNVITGLYPPDRGSVSLGDRQLTGMRPDEIAAVGVARTFQHARPFLELSVLDNVLPMVESTGLEGTGAVERTHELLHVVGLDEFAEEEVGSLPHAHLRLMEIARGLALRPRVVLFDEPAAGLASEEAHQVGQLFELLAEAGLSVVVIEHNMPFVLGIADTVTVLEQGRTIATGTPDEIVDDSKVRRAYLGEDPAEMAGDVP